MKNHSALVSSILQTPGTLTLKGNSAANPDGITCNQLATGHVVFYGPLGRRILLTDHEGHPLHECEWSEHADGTVHLVSARVYLDWGQWVGLKPSGLINTMNLDLSTRPGWQTLTRHDLRLMAVQAMGVALEEVEFFYADDDLVLDPTGHATIRQRKDAFYVLENGTWKRAQFMSCMSAMHWACIDYLPVVELFKSLLPGTGSAVFELIRGLYDDQNPHNPRPLQYRGIPTYPSEAAFGLFSNFFAPTHRGSESPFAVFMDAPRSHEVDWLPTPHPPLRYVDPQHQICLTVKHGKALKATKWDDASGLPFVAPNQQGVAPCGKRIVVRAGQLSLADHKTSHDIALHPGWGITQLSEELPPGTGEQAEQQTMPTGSWEGFFPDGAPVVSPQDAYAAVLLYPEDQTLIDELPSQPFVADFWDDFIEQDPQLAFHVDQSTRILIHGFDAVIGTFLALDRPRSTTIVYAHGAYAQKQAQLLWNQLARKSRLDWQGSYQFVPDDATNHGAYQTTYDLMYVWFPFSSYQDHSKIRDHLQQLSGALQPNGLAFLAGPDAVSSLISGFPLEIVFGDSASNLRPFSMHRSILPRSTLHPDLRAWILKKS